jgi:hypothetical protein
VDAEGLLRVEYEPSDLDEIDFRALWGPPACLDAVPADFVNGTEADEAIPATYASMPSSRRASAATPAVRFSSRAISRTRFFVASLAKISHRVTDVCSSRSRNALARSVLGELDDGNNNFLGINGTARLRLFPETSIALWFPETQDGRGVLRGRSAYL